MRHLLRMRVAFKVPRTPSPSSSSSVIILQSFSKQVRTFHTHGTLQMRFFNRRNHAPFIDNLLILCGPAEMPPPMFVHFSGPSRWALLSHQALNEEHESCWPGSSPRPFTLWRANGVDKCSAHVHSPSHPQRLLNCITIDALFSWCHVS